MDLLEYGKLNPEKFSDIIHLKEKDNVLTHIEAIFQALEIIDGVKFLGATIEEDESKFPEYINKNGIKNVSIAESRFVSVTFKFKLTDTKTGEEDVIEKYIFFPKLIDKTYFILNGNKFFPIYQIIDSGTYNNGNTLTLKTLLMGVSIKISDVSYQDKFGNEFNGNIKLIELFKNKINFLYYYLAEKGFLNTIEYFLGKDAWNNIIGIYDNNEVNAEENKEENFIFALNREESLFISKDIFESNKTFLMNLIDICLNKSLDEILDHNFWINALGKIFSRNNIESKAHDILLSFRRILDNSTKESLRLKPENKEDIYAIIKWMVLNYERLILRDNMDLRFKRIRIYEYLCYDLLKKMSDSTYRLLNKTTDLTLKDRQQLFSTIHPMYLIHKIGTAELLRYYGGVNAIELFNPNLKFSFRGPQGLGDSSKDINNTYRGLHPSYIGRLSLTASSAGDPGITGTMVPFCETEGFYFSKENID